MAGLASVVRGNGAGVVEVVVSPIDMLPDFAVAAHLFSVSRGLVAAGGGPPREHHRLDQSDVRPHELGSGD